MSHQADLDELERVAGRWVCIAYVVSFASGMFTAWLIWGHGIS